MRKIILIISFLSISNAEVINEAKIFWKSQIDQSVVHSVKNLLENDPSNDSELNKKITDGLDSIYFSSTLFDYFLTASQVSKEAKKIYKATGFFNRMNTLIKINYNKRQLELISSMKKDAKAINKIGNELYGISNFKNISSYHQVKSNALRLQRSFYYNRIKRMMKLNNPPSFKNILGDIPDTKLGRLGGALALIGISIDASSATKNYMNGEGLKGTVDVVKAMVHSLQMNPVVGAITVPLEISVNYGAKRYEIHTDNIHSDFFKTTNLFSNSYYSTKNEINELFKNTSYSAEEFRDKFYDEILFSQLSFLLTTKNYYNGIHSTGYMTRLIKIDKPGDNFFYYLHDDFKKANISAKNLTSDILILYMPFNILDESISMSDYSWNLRWGIDDATIRNDYIKDLKKLSQKYFNFSQNDYLISNYIKDELGDIKYEHTVSSNLVSRYKDLQENIKNSFSSKWKRCASEIWLIEHFEKKLLKRKLLDWNRYYSLTLFYNAVKGTVFEKSDLKYDSKNYIDLDYYSKEIKTTLEHADIKIFGQGINLDNEIKSYKEKLKHLSSVEKNKLIIHRGDKFVNAKNDNWAEKYIRNLYKNKYIQGYSDGLFHGNRNITNGEFLKIASRAIMKFNDNIDNYTNDTGKALSKYVKFLNAKKMNIELLDGKKINNNLREDATRGYVAKVIANILKNKNDAQFSKCKKTNNEDWDECSEYLKDMCILHGSLKPKSSTVYIYKPNTKIRRDEISKIISNAMVVSRKGSLCDNKKGGN